MPRNLSHFLLCQSRKRLVELLSIFTTQPEQSRSRVVPLCLILHAQPSGSLKTVFWAASKSKLKPRILLLKILTSLSWKLSMTLALKSANHIHNSRIISVLSAAEDLTQAPSHLNAQFVKYIFIKRTAWKNTWRPCTVPTSNLCKSLAPKPHSLQTQQVD